MVGPEWVVTQAVFLAFGVFLLVLLLWELRIDMVETRRITPRGLCLRLTSATVACFVFNYFDPRASLIFPSLFAHFLDYFTTLCLMQCCSVALFMYPLIVFQQTLTHVPKRLKNIWLGINVIIFALEVLFLIIGTSTDNVFWLGIIDLILIPTHESLIVITWNVNLANITATLKEAQRMTNLPTWNVQGAIRKVCFLRAMSFIIWPTHVLYSVGVFSSGSDRLIRWGAPIELYETEKVGADIFSPIGKTFIFSVLLYALRKPRKKPGATHARSSSKSRMSATTGSFVSTSPTFSPATVRLEPHDTFELDVAPAKKTAHDKYTQLQEPVATGAVAAAAPRESPQLTAKRLEGRLSENSSSGDSLGGSPQLAGKRLEARPSRGSAGTPHESPLQTAKALELRRQSRSSSEHDSPLHVAKRLTPKAAEQSAPLPRESPQQTLKRLDEQPERDVSGTTSRPDEPAAPAGEERTIEGEPLESPNSS